LLVFRGIPERAHSAVALTIGNFDGVHRGHQALIAKLREAAGKFGLPAAVMTFEPHPREFFAPASAPARLSSLREKLELLEACGVDRVHVVRFSEQFAALTPGAFIEAVLVRGLGTRWLAVGDDFRFGAKRAGDFAMLAQGSAEFGFRLETLDSVLIDGRRVSSSAVRAALAAGDMAGAEVLLGRRYGVSGRVLHGDKIGRELGFATANVQMKHNRPPLNGIYVVEMSGLEGGVKQGVASLGLRPTINDAGRATLEVHLFDFNADIYDRHVRVDFLHKLRDEEKYGDLEALKAQIGRDVVAAKQYFVQQKLQQKPQLELE
jgi:riboflavin kinase/FMN adenylyltransferase